MFSTLSCTAVCTKGHWLLHNTERCVQSNISWRADTNTEAGCSNSEVRFPEILGSLDGLLHCSVSVLILRVHWKIKTHIVWRSDIVRNANDIRYQVGDLKIVKFLHVMRPGEPRSFKVGAMPERRTARNKNGGHVWFARVPSMIAVM